VEAVALDTVSYGLILARFSKGSQIVFEQTRVNNETWLPKRAAVRVTGRIGVLRKLDMDREITYSSYRKFRVDSQLTIGNEILPAR
jgi:hypothetical protein